MKRYTEGQLELQREIYKRKWKIRRGKERDIEREKECEEKERG